MSATGLMYRIWDYFSPNEQKAAIAGTYTDLYDTEGRCPLGRAMRHRDDSVVQLCPTASQVADWIVRVGRLPDTATPKRVQRLAEQFIKDWDHGRIHDLATAMGRVEQAGDA